MHLKMPIVISKKLPNFYRKIIMSIWIRSMYYKLLLLIKLWVGSHLIFSLISLKKKQFIWINIDNLLRKQDWMQNNCCYYFRKQYRKYWVIMKNLLIIFWQLKQWKWCSVKDLESLLNLKITKFLIKIN